MLINGIVMLMLFLETKVSAPPSHHSLFPAPGGSTVGMDLFGKFDRCKYCYWWKMASKVSPSFGAAVRNAALCMHEALSQTSF